MTTLEKITYLENKFKAPMDIVLKAINYCKTNNISVEEIELSIK